MRNEIFEQEVWNCLLISITQKVHGENQNISLSIWHWKHLEYFPHFQFQTLSSELRLEPKSTLFSSLSSWKMETNVKRLPKIVSTMKQSKGWKHNLSNLSLQNFVTFHAHSSLKIKFKSSKSILMCFSIHLTFSNDRDAPQTAHFGWTINFSLSSKYFISYSPPSSLFLNYHDKIWRKCNLNSTRK